MTAARLITLAALGSALLLGGALAFQYIGGLAPCKMCIWQRWPHAIAIALALVWAVRSNKAIIWLGALVVLAGAAIGGYHAGVEMGVFSGPDSCTSGPIADVSAEQLLEQILEAPVVRCDEVAWSLLGISMAGWNAIASLVLAGFWAGAARR